MSLTPPSICLRRRILASKLGSSETNPTTLDDIFIVTDLQSTRRILFTVGWICFFYRCILGRRKSFFKFYKEIMDAQHFLFYIILSNYV